MMKKTLALSLSLLLIFTCLASAALTFSDVTADSHPWAINEISDMADKKIINGYPDGSFMPNNNVTKQEALLLISRILGYTTSAAVEDYKNSIYDVFEDDFRNINTQYKREMAFLSWYGAFQPDELEDISFNAPLTREEAAYYVTKAMRQEDEALSYKIPTDLYEDDDLISSTYRRYVYFVREEKYMQGTGIGFAPKDNITRAEIAVLLYRLMGKIDISYSRATVDSVNVSQRTAKIYIGTATKNIDADVLIRNKGNEINVASLYKGLDGIALIANDEIIQLEVFFEAADVAKTVDGEIRSTASTGMNSVILKNPDTDMLTTYYLDENCRIFINNSDATFANIRTGDYATLDLDNAERVLTLTVSPSTAEVTNVTIKEMIITNTDTSLVVEKSDGSEETFTLTGKSLIIKKNGKVIDIAGLYKGDKLSKISLRFGRIVEIESTSNVSTLSGSITEILISPNSKITLSNGSESSVYNITRDTQIYVFGEAKTIYDLRLTHKANLTLDGNAVSKIEVSTQAQSNDAKGVIESINTSYGFINVVDVDGTAVQIFINSKTKIIDNNSNLAQTVTIRDIKVGQSILAVGALVNGAFEAQTIVIAK